MKTIIFAGAAALAFSAGASAQHPQAPAGEITRAAALADAERRFAALDADRDGLIAPAEMRQAREQRRAERLARLSPEERARFEQRRAERGGDGRGGEGRRGARGGPGGERGPVTLAEFRDRAGERFDRLDLDRNGVISRAEQEQLRAARGGGRRGGRTD
ncbi:MAG TPA: hypothetical protein VGB08_10660 [Allosphingosinicella sp.]|jgi:hypothetical protein